MNESSRPCRICFFPAPAKDLRFSENMIRLGVTADVFLDKSATKSLQRQAAKKGVDGATQENAAGFVGTGYRNNNENPNPWAYKRIMTYLKITCGFIPP